jgi:predicted phosphodiesterase
MKIRLFSDTHVNFYNEAAPLIDKLNKYFVNVNSKKELLIVAGDVGNFVTGNKIEQKYLDMLKYFCSRWNHIILVPGNHEWYNSKIPFETVDNMMRNECKNLGIIYLNKNIYKYKDYTFIGCTLWSNVDKRFWPFMKHKYEGFMTYEKMIKINANHIEWLDKTLKSLYNKKVIVITHHLPSRKLIGGIYVRPEYRISNTAYFTDLEWLIRKNSNIQYWFCGHSHVNKLVTIGNTVIYLNPIGNPKDEIPKQVYRETLEIL